MSIKGHQNQLHHSVERIMLYNTCQNNLIRSHHYLGVWLRIPALINNFNKSKSEEPKMSLSTIVTSAGCPAGVSSWNRLVSQRRVSAGPLFVEYICCWGAAKWLKPEGKNCPFVCPLMSLNANGFSQVLSSPRGTMTRSESSRCASQEKYYKCVLHVSFLLLFLSGCLPSLQSQDTFSVPGSLWHSFLIPILPFGFWVLLPLLSCLSHSRLLHLILLP